MKQITIILLLFLFSGLLQTVNAQQAAYSDEKKSQQQTRREQRQAEREAHERKIIQMLRDTTMVLEMSTLYGVRGDSYQLNRLSNFFAIVGRLASIQYAFNQFRGFSGLEGLMNTGDLIAYELIEPTGKKPILVKGRIAPHSTSSMVLFEMHVFKNGRVRMNMTTASGRRVNIEGELIHPNESAVFKTLPLFRKVE
jgi:hypothetical protein